ncbi:chromatin binding protein, partial [Nowakowskiella sp. JEL0078]
MLAAGCLDGRCIVWDFYTRGISQILKGHVQPVTSVSWTRKGRHILTSSKDWNCIYWDLLDGTKDSIIRFQTPVLFAQLHPYKPL